MGRLFVIGSGLLFGFGLDLARMTDPARVLGFLDVAGRWDPTLLFVMAGALAVSVPGFALLRRRGATWFAGTLRLPERRDLDGPLVGGAALFGVGWGLAGYCPGPGIAALSHGALDPAWFVVGMLLGMLAYAALGRRTG
ncbi:MAG: DUF6691 family protein [Halofilum sp. (in: g-proteobacteria)]|nr:DUF6691 family protein [Halofilum sp. (in: g-proteobacteria)]